MVKRWKQLISREAQYIYIYIEHVALLTIYATRVSKTPLLRLNELEC